MGRAVALGIDLAWSDRNHSAVCAVDENGRVVDERLVISDEELIDWVDEQAAQAAVLALDAPLHVPNQVGMRDCERELNRHYGARGASAHASNRARLISVHGRIRGEELPDRLAALGFTGPFEQTKRTLIEVYPHPAIVEMFGLDQRLPYKAKRGRTPAERREGLRRLDRLIARLDWADPPIHVQPVDIADDMRGRSLKKIEDLLDARICAWIAAAWAKHGQDAVRLFGSGAEGHIAVPTIRVDVPDEQTGGALDALAAYRRTRQALLDRLGLSGSNRDPLSEFSEHLAAELLDARPAASRVQRGYDLVGPGDSLIEVKYLANPPDGWINQHTVASNGVWDRYALVIYESLWPRHVLVFPQDLGPVTAALGKRHPQQDKLLQLTRRNYLQVVEDPDRFAALGVEVFAIDDPRPTDG